MRNQNTLHSPSSFMVAYSVFAFVLFPSAHGLSGYYVIWLKMWIIWIVAVLKIVFVKV